MNNARVKNSRAVHIVQKIIDFRDSFFYSTAMQV
jgi:hypothetical protein